MSDNDINALYKDVKEQILFLKNNILSVEEEKGIRDNIIEYIKYLITNEEIEDAQRRILQFMLTKLYMWTPFHTDFKGVGDLPILIEQLSNTIEILTSDDIIKELQITHFRDDGQIRIEEQSPVPITLDNAFEIIENFPTLEQYKGNFIGFFNEKGESINFLRQDANLWLLDLPILDDADYSVNLSDDTLSTEAVKEIISNFFTDINIMKELRKKLEITESIKQILNYEISIGTSTNKEELIANLGFSKEDGEFYFNVLNLPIEYEEFEIPKLKLKAKQAFKRILEPNLYEFILNMGMDIYTAKKVGKYLIDIGWINEFPRLPVPK